MNSHFYFQPFHQTEYFESFYQPLIRTKWDVTGSERWIMLKHLELDATWSLSILPVLLIIFQVLDKTLVF